MSKGKRAACLALTGLLMALPCLSVHAVDAYYESYTYNSRGEAIPAPAAYTAMGTVSGESAGTAAFSSPADLFADTDNGRLYVADTGNNRIVVLDETCRFVSEYTGVSG